MKTVTYESLYESHYPYSRGYYYTTIGAESIARLFELLPHGSGIDYTWYVHQQKSNPNRYQCSNAYHAMDENGYYNAVYDFTVYIDYDAKTDKFHIVRFSFHGQKELSDNYGLFDYIQESLSYAIEG